MTMIKLQPVLSISFESVIKPVFSSTVLRMYSADLSLRTAFFLIFIFLWGKGYWLGGRLARVSLSAVF